MSITNDDIQPDWEPGDAISVTIDGDGDADGGDADGGDGADADGGDA